MRNDDHEEVDYGADGADERLERLAYNKLGQLCQADPRVMRSLQRARAEYRRLGRRRQELAATKAAHARAAEDLAHVDSDDGHGGRTVPLGVGWALLTLVALADLVPLFWAAQSFSQGLFGTAVITGILFAATIAGMVFLERSARKAIVIGLIVVAYLGLVVLRARYLAVVDGASTAGALLEAGAISAISGLLLALGSVLLARVELPSHNRARRLEASTAAAVASSSARVAAAEPRATEAAAVFSHDVLPVALGALPEGAEPDRWRAALRGQVERLISDTGNDD